MTLGENFGGMTLTLHTDFYHILWFFIIYCVCGWIWESTYCSVKARKWINRGFLMGPYIPIYGCGALVVYLTLYPLKEQLWLVYIGGVIFPTILEFLTSWIMEKLFAATWWDYSNEKYNIQGRICLKVSLFWGFFSLVMVEILHPFVLSLIEKLPRTAGQVLGGIFVVVFSADLVNTVLATLDVKKTLEKMEDVREDIAQFLEVHKRYEESIAKPRAVFQHHIKAYPNFKSAKYAMSLEDMKKDMKKRLEKLRKEK